MAELRTLQKWARVKYKLTVFFTSLQGLCEKVPVSYGQAGRYLYTIKLGLKQGPLCHCAKTLN